MADETPTPAPPAPEGASAPNRRRPAPPQAGHRIVAFRGTRGLEAGESIIYLLVGACFLGAAALSLIFGIVSFALTTQALFHEGLSKSMSEGAGATAIINFVSDLLLTLIILEVMGTVVRYLQVRATSLKPFLIIGIISATRGVLAVGARLSVGGTEVTVEGFRHSMIELVVNAAVIIALGVTLWLIGRRFGDDVEEAVPTDVAESDAH